VNSKEKKRPSSFQVLFLSSLSKDKLIKQFRERFDKEIMVKKDEKVELELRDDMLKHIQSLSIKRRKNGLLLFYFMTQYSESFLKLSLKNFGAI